METVDRLIKEHWNYVKELLLVSGIDYADLYKYEFHYKSAFKHGFKHGVEYIKNSIYERKESANVEK